MGKQKNKKTSKKDENTPVPLPDAEIDDTNGHQSQSSNGTQNTKPIDQIKKITWPERTLAIATVVLVLVTSVLAFYTYKLFSESVGQSEKTQRSIELAQENFRIENRAWVGLTHPPTHKGSIYGLMVGQVYSIQIRNFGKTPAESLRYWKSFFFSNQLPKPKITTPFSEESRTLSPNEQFSIDIGVDSSFDENLLAKIGRQKRLFLYAIITYKDIYGIIDTTEFVGIYDSEDAFSPYGTINRME